MTRTSSVRKIVGTDNPHSKTMAVSGAACARSNDRKKRISPLPHRVGTAEEREEDVVVRQVDALRGRRGLVGEVDVHALRLRRACGAFERAAHAVRAGKFFTLLR